MRWWRCASRCCASEDLPEAGGLRRQLSYVLPAEWAARAAGERAFGHCRRCPQHALPTFAELVGGGVPADSGAGAGADGARMLPATHACAVAAWTGPQARARIETVLCEARITRVLLTTLGQVTGMVQITENVTKAQRRALAARDLGCAARGCTRPPAFCDAHHLVAQADGGPNVLGNLVHSQSHP